MIVRMVFAAAVATLLGSTIAAQAQDSAGMIVCEQDVRSASRYLEDNRERLSEQAIRNAEQRLDVARAQCNSSPQLGLNTVAALRRDLGTEVESQTAQQPGESPEPQGQ